MKKIALLIISVLLFVTLFYRQMVGLNFGILAIIIWGLIHYITPKVKQDKFYWLLSVSVFLAGFSQMWYADGWTFITLYLTLLVFGIYAQYKKLSLISYPFIVALNYLLTPFRFLSFKWLPKSIEKKQWLQKAVAYVFIPMVILSLFAGIYITGSESFYNLFKSLLNLKLWNIIFLSALGIFLFFNFWFLFIPRNFISINSNFSDDFGQSEKNIFSVDLTLKSGEITMVLVNLLLLIFVITYNYEQFFVKQEIAQLSNDTHLRVVTVIFSIIMAIGLILFYFRSKSSFDAKANNLKTLTYVWLILNSALVFSAFIKNGQYVFHYGLTLKRSGVFIFLALCFVGMAYSYLKIKNHKTNYYLLNRMAWVFFFTMVVTTAINFSWVVTKYNLTFQDQPDYEYLTSLNYNYYILSKSKDQNLVWDKSTKYRPLNPEQPFIYRRLYDKVIVK